CCPGSGWLRVRWLRRRRRSDDDADEDSVAGQGWIRPGCRDGGRLPVRCRVVGGDGARFASGRCRARGPTGRHGRGSGRVGRGRPGPGWRRVGLCAGGAGGGGERREDDRLRGGRARSAGADRGHRSAGPTRRSGFGSVPGRTRPIEMSPMRSTNTNTRPVRLAPSEVEVHPSIPQGFHARVGFIRGWVPTLVMSQSPLRRRCRLMNRVVSLPGGDPSLSAVVIVMSKSTHLVTVTPPRGRRGNRAAGAIRGPRATPNAARALIGAEAAKVA